VVELSRRHGPEWSCPARSRKSASAPIPAYVPRRSFRSSLAVLESSSESANPSEDGSVSRPTWGGSKIGGRWGAKQPLKPATLSPAEQALRDSLIARKAASAKEKEAEKQRRQGFALHEKTDDSLRVLDVSGTRKNSASLRERQPEKNVDVASSRPATNLRVKDWKCPRCQFRCFGRASTCPRCGAPKPKLDAPAPGSPRQIKQEQNALKIRRLAQSLRSEYESQRSGRRLGEWSPKAGGSRSIALDNYLVETGRKTESPPASAESDTQSMAEQRLSNARDKVTESRGADRHASGAGRKSSKPEADPSNKSRTP
jgi:translation initiation factor IF-2